MKVDLDELERKAHPIVEWDEERDAPEQECVACKGSMHTPSELDPTPLCNGCAQGYAWRAASELLALIARIRELEHALDLAADTIELAGLKVAPAKMRELLARGAVLP